MWMIINKNIWLIVLYYVHYSASLASLTRETGPKLVKGDPAKKSESNQKGIHHHHFDYTVPTIAVSDSSLKFTHVLYNLSPAGNY